MGRTVGDDRGPRLRGCESRYRGLDHRIPHRRFDVGLAWAADDSGRPWRWGLDPRLLVRAFGLAAVDFLGREEPARQESARPRRTSPVRLALAGFVRRTRLRACADCIVNNDAR